MPEGTGAYVFKTDEPYRDAGGQAFDDRDFVGEQTFPTMDPATSFPYSPVFGAPSDATVKVPAWLNDRARYHNRGDAKFDGGESDT